MVIHSFSYNFEWKSNGTTLDTSWQLTRLNRRDYSMNKRGLRRGIVIGSICMIFQVLLWGSIVYLRSLFIHGSSWNATVIIIWLVMFLLFATLSAFVGSAVARHSIWQIFVSIFTLVVVNFALLWLGGNLFLLLGYLALS